MTPVPHPLMRQLAAAREQAGLSRDEWSARLGMPLSTLSYVERGISPLSLAALELLARDLGFEVVLRKADEPAQPAAARRTEEVLALPPDGSAIEEGGTDELGALRDRIGTALRDAFDAAIVAEWICCEPVRADHDVCSRGEAMRLMVRALLADDPEFHPERSPILDAVMDALRDAGYRIARPITTDEEAEDARLWN